MSIGPQGSGSANVSEQLLSSAGMMDHILVYLSFGDSATSLRDGHMML